MTTVTSSRTTNDHQEQVDALIQVWSSHTDSDMTSRLAVTTTGDRGEIIQPDVIDEDYDSENLNEFKNLLESIITDTQESDKTANVTLSYYNHDDVELTNPQRVYTWDISNGSISPKQTDASEPGWNLS